MTTPSKPVSPGPRAAATRSRRATASTASKATEAAKAAESAATVDGAMLAAAAAAAAAADRRLAGVHLRMGSLLLARAELEHLWSTARLDPSGLADLAEARWRTGDLAGAAEAAQEHLAANGAAPIARVIAAEAAAAAGRSDEARSHVAALGLPLDGDLDQLFAGMPRRAIWPSAPDEHTGEPPGTVTDRADRADAAADLGLWPADADDRPPAAAPAASRRRATSRPVAPDPGSLLDAGRADVRHGEPGRVAVGLDRLALALRADPTLASRILDALGQHREPAALVLRGDACRILGRLLEAEAAYAAAAGALANSTPRATR